MYSLRFSASYFAAAFLRGNWIERLLIARARKLHCYRPRDLASLVRRVLAAFPDRASAGIDNLTEFLMRDPEFGQRIYRGQLLGFCYPRASMQPTAAAVHTWNLPAIASPGQLADWLGLTLPELDWFADVRRRNYRAPLGRLQHYRYHVIRKSNGRVRLLESPKQKLKALQRKILHELLDLVPAHAAVHGFRRGHSIVTYAAPHVGQAMVLRLDLCDFFVSVPARRVRALFRTLGYPRQVAHLLTGLCTHATPEAAWPDNAGQNSDPVLSERKRNEDWLTRRRHAGPHLPQGAPTSPALANLCAFRLDARLSGLADAAGAGYTRYADDLAFSGGADFARAARRFQHHAARIILEEGFDVNWKKTRRMRPATQQRLAGVVVNVRPNIRRKDYDVLKAILHNCRRHGPHLQNRTNNTEFRAHLLGRIAHVASIHAERGRKLRLAFDDINWNR